MQPRLTVDTSVSATLQPVCPNKQNVTLCIMGVSVWLAVCLGLELRRDVYGCAQNRAAVIEHVIRHCAYWAIGVLANSIEVTSVDDNALWIYQHEVRCRMILRTERRRVRGRHISFVSLPITVNGFAQLITDVEGVSHSVITPLRKLCGWILNKVGRLKLISWLRPPAVSPVVRVQSSDGAFTLPSMSHYTSAVHVT